MAASLVRDRARAEAELAAAARAGDTRAIANVEAPEVPQGLSARSVVSWRLVDESKVPEEFWMRTLDGDKILAAVKAGRAVPGVERIVETEIRRTGR